MPKHNILALVPILSFVFTNCSTVNKNAFIFSSIEHILERKEYTFPHEPINNKEVSTYIQEVLQPLLTKSNSRNTLVTVERTAWVQGWAFYANNSIGVTRGMLNMIHNEAELACLLGHEIGHQKLRHAEKRFQKSIVHELTEEFVISEIERRNLKNLLNDQLNEIASAGWNRIKEQEADLFGVDLAAKAGYNPFAFADLFDRLALRVKNDPLYYLKKYKGTHKALTRRAKEVRKYLYNKGYKPGVGKSNGKEYREALSSLKVLRTNEEPEHRAGGSNFMEERIYQDSPTWGKIHL